MDQAKCTFLLFFCVCVCELIKYPFFDKDDCISKLGNDVPEFRLILFSCILIFLIMLLFTLSPHAMNSTDDHEVNKML